MCEPRYWMKVYTAELKEDRYKSLIIIHAERSDLEIFNFKIELDGNDSLGNIASKVKRAIDSLESYRECDCSVKLGVCLKHMDSLRVTQPQAANSAVITGRR